MTICRIFGQSLSLTPRRTSTSLFSVSIFKRVDALKVVLANDIRYCCHVVQVNACSQPDDISLNNMTTISDVIRQYNLSASTSKNRHGKERGRRSPWSKRERLAKDSTDCHRSASGLWGTDTSSSCVGGAGYRVLVEQDPLLQDTDIFSIFAVQPGRQDLRRASPARGTTGDRRAAAQSLFSQREGAREYLQQQLPDYMIPSSFIMLGSLPLTPTASLTAMHSAPGSHPRRGFRGPADSRRIQDGVDLDRVVGVERVSRTSNFFELGGDSILGIQLVARANQSGFRLDPRYLFEHPTLEKLALVSSTLSRTIETEPATGPSPLTPIQRWFFEQNMPQPESCCQAIFSDDTQTRDCRRPRTCPASGLRPPRCLAAYVFNARRENGRH